MEKVSGLTPLFTAGIFLISFLALLLTGFNYMLGPLKERVGGMEQRMDKRMNSMERRMDSMDKKLDRLLSRKISQRLEKRK